MITNKDINTNLEVVETAILLDGEEHNTKNITLPTTPKFIIKGQNLVILGKSYSPGMELILNKLMVSPPGKIKIEIDSSFNSKILVKRIFINKWLLGHLITTSLKTEYYNREATE